MSRLDAWHREKAARGCLGRPPWGVACAHWSEAHGVARALHAMKKPYRLSPLCEPSAVFFEAARTRPELVHVYVDQAFSPVVGSAGLDPSTGPQDVGAVNAASELARRAGRQPLVGSWRAPDGTPFRLYAAPGSLVLLRRSSALEAGAFRWLDVRGGDSPVPILVAYASAAHEDLELELALADTTTTGGAA